MAIQTSTLRPGLLVSLKTSTRGNVSYFKEPIEDEPALVDDDVEQQPAADEPAVTGIGNEYAADAEAAAAAKAEVAKWKTTRTIADAEEHARGQKARAKAGAMIRGCCAHSAFGLLCPEADADKLAAAIEEARAIIEAFNAGASVSRISLYVITGRIAPDDVEAIKAINSEIKDLMNAMALGVEKCDVKSIREAAAKAKQVGEMLSPDAQARVQIAVEAARGGAKRIVAAGESAAQEVDRSVIRKITECRTAFLDLSDEKAVAAPAVPARTMDLLGDDAPVQPKAPKASRRSVEV